jgi:N-acetyl-gamma-glutamyl-phosphate reductase
MSAIPKIFIDGEAGTTGLQIRERLSHRKDIDLISIPDSQRKDSDARKKIINEVDIVILCLPDEAAKESVSFVQQSQVRILDASTAHRCHPDWVYGFPELSAKQPDKIRQAKRVSNPGCYATGALALLAPLSQQTILPHDIGLTIFGVSGYSGGGRQMIDSFEGRGDNINQNAYQIYALNLRHKHIPEITYYANLSRKPIFLPSVGRFKQGMIVSIPLHKNLLSKPVSAKNLFDIMTTHYQGSPSIKVMSCDNPPIILSPEGLNDTNELEIYGFDNQEDQTVLLVARLDNLGKGASGAAVQNLDLMLEAFL